MATGFEWDLGWDLGFGIWDLGFGIWDLGFGIWDLGFGIWDLGFGIWDLGFGIWDLRLAVYRYCLSTLVPRRHTISHGMVPIAAAISRASICCHDSSPWRPIITTSSPGSTSMPVTSA